MPCNKFAIFSIQRTGSTLLCEKLSSLDSCLCHYELFNPQMVGINNKKSHALKGYDVEKRDANFDEFYNKIFEQEEGAVGFKIFYDHSPRAIIRTLSDESVKKIILKRDMLTTYVSRQQAIASKIWISTQGNDAAKNKYREPVHIDLNDFDKYCTQIIYYYNFIESFCKETKQNFFTLYYFNVIKENGLSRLINWLGLQQNNALSNFRLEKQGKKTLKERISNFEEVYEHCKKNYPDSLILQERTMTGTKRQMSSQKTINLNEYKNEDFMINGTLNLAKEIINTRFYTIAQPFLQYADEIEKTYNIFCDDESKINYRREILFRILAPIMGPKACEFASPLTVAEFQKLCRQADIKNPQFLTYGEDEGIKRRCRVRVFDFLQYHYKDKVTVKNGDVVVDAGSCYGEFSLFAVQHGAASVIAFEAFPSNVENSLKTAKHHNYDNKLTIIQKAMGKTCSPIFFHTTGGDGSGFCSEKRVAEQDVEIPQTTLDAVSKELKKIPTFIKMDIEGAELSALQGATEVLSNYPKLAISIYHKINDMWEIPLFIKNNFPDYKFYCKKSSPFGECVLFCSPAGK